MAKKRPTRPKAVRAVFEALTSGHLTTLEELKRLADRAADETVFPELQRYVCLLPVGWSVQGNRIVKEQAERSVA